MELSHPWRSPVRTEDGRLGGGTNGNLRCGKIAGIGNLRHMFCQPVKFLRPTLPPHEEEPLRSAFKHRLLELGMSRGSPVFQHSLPGQRERPESGLMSHMERAARTMPLRLSLFLLARPLYVPTQMHGHSSQRVRARAHYMRSYGA